jgi:cytosine/adenosine deaminase-related metal-dependent hydrolase
MSEREVVLRGGRVVDPDSGVDAVLDVAIAQGQVVEVGTALPPGRTDVDVSAMVVTAGFVDLHSHAQDVAGLRLQACDGVTTALELEAGITPVDTAYRSAGAEGRPINYGFAASWALARMEAVGGIGLDGTLLPFLLNVANPAWQRPAGQDQIAAMLARLSADLADGAVGIGVLAGYAPATDPQEYLQVASLAADAGVPTFTHSRDIREIVPEIVIDGADEIVRAAAETGAHMHYCHVNSTSMRHVDRVLDTVQRAQAAGARISTEAYPYGSGMTAIGAAFLAPERLAERDLTPSSLTYAPTGERVASEARLRELRQTDPGGLVIIHLLDDDDPADRPLLLRSLLIPETVVASDAMPLTWNAQAPDPLAWPLPPAAVTHPRTAGTFSRALRLLTREGGPFTLAEALSKCSLRPAQLLQDRVPAMARKGRLQVGSDADIVIFDSDTISDQATYGNSTRPSTGIRHVLVNGTFVVQDGELVTGVLPGQSVRASPR